MYRYDGVNYVICVRSEGGEADIPRDSSRTDARLFFLVRAEPKEVMEKLEREHPLFRPFDSKELPFSNALTSEGACEGVGPFDLEQYLVWDPRHRTL